MVGLLIPFLLINQQAQASTEISVQINGQTLYFDQPPVMENGRVLVPMRTIFEVVGADVQWVAPTSTVKATKGDLTISLPLNHKQAIINGVKKDLDVPAKSINGRTLVPLRFVSETLGCTVEWKAEKSLVLITYNGEIKQQIGKVYPDDWVAPLLKSEWSPSHAMNLKTLQNELGFENDGRTYGVTGRSEAVQVIGQAPSGPYEVELLLYMWTDSAIPESYRIPIVAKELFKLYFGNDATKVWNYCNSGNIPDHFTANGRNVDVYVSSSTGGLTFQVGRK